MIRFKTLSILLLILIFSVMSCSSSKNKEPVTSDPYGNYSDEQQTQMQSEGTSTWEDSGNLSPSETTDPQPDPGTQTDWGSTPTPGSSMMGFRVQIAAMSTQEAALAEAQKAAGKLNVAGYVDYQGGLWKVHMGNARTREEAEVLRDYARNKGYTDAWIVNTEIKVE